MRTFINRWILNTLLFYSLAFFLASTCFAVTESTEIDITSEISTTLVEPLSKESVRDLVATLSDDAVRALLIERLDAVAKANDEKNQTKPSVLEAIGNSFKIYLQNAKQVISATGEIPQIQNKVFETMKRSSSYGLTQFSFYVSIAILFGIIAERLVALYFKKLKQKLIDSFSTKLWGILKIIYTRLAIDILGVIAFTIASNIVLKNYFEEGTLQYQYGLTIIKTIMAGWMGYVIGRFFFAPKRPDLRICSTSDERAMRITVSYTILAAYIVLMHNLYYTLVQIGVEYYGGFEYMRPLGYWMNNSMYVFAGWIVWYNKNTLTEILLENKKRVYLAIGEKTTDDLSWFALNWPKLAILLVFCKYIMVEIILHTADIGVYSTGAVYITFIVILLWPGIDANVSLFVGKGITSPEDETEAAAQSRRTMQQGLLRVGRILVVGIVLYSLARLWGLNILDLANSGLGAKTTAKLVEFLFILLTSYISWELVSALIGYWMALEGGAPDDEGEDAGGEIGGVGLSRTATLLPIIRKTAQFLIIVVTIITLLDNWGVNIGPILAGAGVVGLAIGFGAQTLVKDIVSGLFFLADDAFRVGEYIDVGGTMGSVEKISLRSLRLRHHKGLVHTIPYGEIPKLTNFSRDWVIMKLRFRVPFDADIRKIKKIFKKIGADLLEDPILGEDFLQPFKSQGVAEVDDNGIVVRGKFMAKPGRQFMIRKEVYVRVQKAFDEAGIPFARKQVMVHIPGLDNSEKLQKEDLSMIGAAAAEAAEEPVPTR